MSYNPAPKSFFGPTYALTSSAIVLPTVDDTDVTIGTFTATAASAVLTTSVAHNLKVGDKVAISSSTTLPAPFTAADHFVVAVTSTETDEIQLSLTKGGTAITATDTGTGTHTIVALSLLQDVTDVEAHATDGDWRKVLYGIHEMIFQKWTNTPTADRPAKISIARSSSVNETTGAITRYYTTTIVTEPSASEVVSE